MQYLKIVCLTLSINMLLSICLFSQDVRMQIRKNVPLDSIRLSDPFILADSMTNMYYMTGTGGMLWKSVDLKYWEGPFSVAKTDPTSWMGPRPMIWAAEIHAYKGKYYYFGTFTNRAIVIDSVKENVINRRACHVLVTDKPTGQFIPMKDSIYLPADKPALDATFWIDASSSKEKGEYGTELPNMVTDGPYLFRTSTWQLGIIWTSWVNELYTQGVAYSLSGTLDGPWKQEQLPITPPNYGHGMLFRTLNGKLLMCLHSHENKNGQVIRIPKFFKVDLTGDKLVVGKQYQP